MVHVQQNHNALNKHMILRYQACACDIIIRVQCKRKCSYKTESKGSSDWQLHQVPLCPVHTVQFEWNKHKAPMTHTCDVWNDLMENIKRKECSCTQWHIMHMRKQITNGPLRENDIGRPYSIMMRLYASTPIILHKVISLVNSNM